MKISNIKVILLYLLVISAISCYFVLYGVPIHFTMLYLAYLLFALFLPGYWIARYFKNNIEHSLVLAYPFGLGLELLFYPIFKYFQIDYFYLPFYAVLSLSLILLMWVRRGSREYAISFDIKSVLSTLFIAALFAVYLDKLYYPNHLLPTIAKYVEYYFDYTWTMGNTSAMLLNFPPDYIHASGITTFKYHYFLNIHMASMARLTDIPGIYSFLRFYPVIDMFIVSMIILYGIVLRNKSYVGGVLAVVFTFFLTGFEYRQAIDVQYLTHIYFSPTTYFFSLIFFIPLLMEICDVIENNVSGTKVKNILLLTLCILGAKGNALTVILGGISVVAALNVNKYKEKRWQLLAVISALFVVCTIIAAKTIFADISQQFQVSLTFQDMMKAVFVNIKNTSLWLYSGKVVANYQMKVFVVLLLYYVVYLGFRVLPGFLSVVYKGRFSKEWFLTIAMTCSFYAMFIFVLPGMSQIYYGFYAIQIGALLIGLTLPEYVEFIKKSKFKIFYYSIITVGLIVSFISMPRHFISEDFKPTNSAVWAHSKMSQNQYKAFMFLNANTSRDALLFTNRLYYKAFKVRNMYTYLAAFSQRKVYLEGTGFFAPNKEADSIAAKRYDEVEGFFTGKIKDVGTFLKQRGITHVVFDKTIDYYNIMPKSKNLELILSNDDVDVYKVVYSI